MSDEMKAHPVIPADMTRSHNSPSLPEFSLKILSPRFKFPEPAILKGLSCFICFQEISLSRNLLRCDRCSHQYKTRVAFYYRRRQWHPLQCSCLENPMDGGAWWAAVHGVAKSDMTEWLHLLLSCIGEGNRNPLQCSCLENPREKGAWWAAVYGIAQSWTRLKWLSNSNSCKERNMTI